MRCYASFILILLAVTLLVGQSNVSSANKKVQNGRAVSKPISPTNILSVVIPQPDCPLKIEKASVANVDGRLVTSYVVRDFGNKTITGYTIARWYSDNTGDVLTGEMPVIKANAYFPSNLAMIESQKSLGASAPSDDIKRIAFFMIVEILFSDGSTFSDLRTLNSLENHLKYFESTYERFDKNRYSGYRSSFPDGAYP